MARLLILLALIGAAYWFVRWFRRTPPHQVSAGLRKGLLWGAIAVVVLAAVTGRLNPLFAALAAAVPIVIRIVNLVRMLPMMQQVLRAIGLGGLAGGVAGATGSSQGNGQSKISTRFLDMRLDHESGQMDGEVREGPFAGNHLYELALDQLLRMLELYEDADAQSAAVLRAYLDREHPDWLDDWETAADETGGSTGRSGRQSQGRQSGADATAMTTEEAWSILGLEPGADAAAIRAAHRRLMQKFHPDRGGSDYLAAQINAAKSLLMNEKRR